MADSAGCIRDLHILPPLCASSGPLIMDESPLSALSVFNETPKPVATLQALLFAQLPWPPSLNGTEGARHTK